MEAEGFRPRQRIPSLIQRNDPRPTCAYLGPFQLPREPAMTVQETPYPVVGRMVDIFGDWLKHRRELREMRQMDAANFGRIAGELRMSSADL